MNAATEHRHALGLLAHAILAEKDELLIAPAPASGSRSSLRHSGQAHALIHALAPREIDGIVAER